MGPAQVGTEDVTMVIAWVGTLPRLLPGGIEVGNDDVTMVVIPLA